MISTTKYCRKLLILTFFLSNLTASLAANEYIDKARSFIGDEDTLSKVESIEFIGKFSGKAFPDELNMHLIVALQNKREKYYLKLSTESWSEVIAMNGYEGYSLRTDRQAENNNDLNVLTAEKVESLKIEVMENLNPYYAYKAFRGAEFSDKGDAIFQGKNLRNLVFKYKNGDFFERYIDASTGELVATNTKEKVYMLTDDYKQTQGISLPYRIRGYESDKNNEEPVYVMAFTEININKTFDSLLFDFPKTLP